jgi:hypothetical protein
MADQIEHQLVHWLTFQYMTFGSTLITSEESTEELQRQAEVYLRAAWGNHAAPDSRP